MRSWFALINGCVFVCLAGLAANASERAIELKQHKPSFHWKTSSNGQQSIYDADMLVTDFYAGPTTMHGIGRPISLHNLRLIPGGPPAIRKGEGCGPLCLSWRKHLIFYMKIDELRPNDSDPQRFKLYVRSHDVGLRSDQPNQGRYEPKNVVEESWLELTYDPALPSYVFDVKTRMTVQPGREQRMIDRDFRGLEFGDILPAQCNVPLERKQFHHYIYQGSGGAYYRLPHDKNRGPEKMNIRFSRGGTLAFLLESHHNPVVELVGDTGLNSFSEICHAMYDVHFKFAKETQLKLLAVGKPLEAHYRFYSISEAAGREMLDRATWDPKLCLPGAVRPPLAVDSVYRFEPTSDTGQRTGPFAPESPAAACDWDNTTGYRSPASLSIRGESPEDEAFWKAWLDPHHSEGLQAGKQYRVTAMVKTDRLTGEACLIWQDRHGVRQSSQPLSGTTPWTRVELKTDPVTGPVVLKLMQSGAGQSWFDEVTVVSRR